MATTFYIMASSPETGESMLATRDDWFEAVAIAEEAGRLTGIAVYVMDGDGDMVWPPSWRINGGVV